MVKYLTICIQLCGGALSAPVFFASFKWVNVAKLKFMTFPNYQKHKFWKKNLLSIFRTYPLNEGGIKNEVIEKLVKDPLLLNIIFKANENKNESKRWALYLNNGASYIEFQKSTQAKSHFLKKFKFQNLAQFLRFGPEFLHVISIFIKVQTLNSNMVCLTLLLISWLGFTYLFLLMTKRIGLSCFQYHFPEGRGRHKSKILW